MLRCADCEFADIGPHGEVRLKCNPFLNIKEPECLQKWQLMKLDAMVQAYAATLNQYRRLAPLQEKMMKYMEKEIEDIDEGEKWKTEWDDEDEGGEDDKEDPSLESR